MIAVILFAAHQGEEFVLILPAAMLAAAFFIMRWANQSDAPEGDSEDASVEAPAVADNSVEDASVQAKEVGTRDAA